VTTSNEPGLPTQVIFDIKDKVGPDAFMITWRLHTSPHVVEDFILINLIHLNAKNGEFPEMIVVVFANL
jgi:hypothetical protein